MQQSTLFATTLFCLAAHLCAGADTFIGAPEPVKPPKQSPLSAEDQLATFTVPPGFKVELVAADPDISKVVTVAFDNAGRMWAVTASEYPVDENESPQRARSLYERGGKDRVLVFDTPTAEGRQKPRTFADGLAISLGVLPYRNGAIVHDATTVAFVEDTNGDGKADKKTTWLSGWGIQDSHLMPHQFTRTPGDWFFVAQGAFNSSQVKDADGRVTPFPACKLGRFKPGGHQFEIVGWGLNNIWGIVIDRRGEVFIHEANDLGYPVVPFFVGANYPGIGDHRAKPYAPWQPPLANFSMGGTGLSGLALAEDRNAFPAPYAGVTYVANPITRHIQAIRVHADGAHHRLEKLPDFVNCSDEWFRPIAITFGPDGCLYIVDWYNKIISHNEVAREHPDRDKTRGRIWRVRHESQPRRTPPDLTTLATAELAKRLDADVAWEARSARFEVIDRGDVSVVPRLARSSLDANNSPELRLNALWALEGLKSVGPKFLAPLLRDRDRNLRRETVRVLTSYDTPESAIVPLLEPLVNDRDPQVRAEVIRGLSRIASPGVVAIELLVRMARAPLEGPTVKTQQGGYTVHTGAAADRDFERYLARAALERHPEKVVAFLDSPAAGALPAENRVLAALALDARTAAERIVALGPKLDRALRAEELAVVAKSASEPGVAAFLERQLTDAAQRVSTLNALIQAKDQINSAAVRAFVAPVAKTLLASVEHIDLGLRAVAALQLSELEGEVVAVVTRTNLSSERQLAAVRALREINSPRVDVFQRLAMTSKAPDAVRREALVALAGARSERGLSALMEIWPVLNAASRKVAVDRLTTSKQNSQAFVAAIKRGDISRDALDDYTLKKLTTVLGDDKELAEFRQAFASNLRPVLRLNGGNDDYVAEAITLRGAFTVETWINLDGGIGNPDGILGAPGNADFNFHDARFRVYGGPPHGDVIIANRRVEADVWTHVAVTRDADGKFKIYLDGELDADKCKPLAADFVNLNIGRTAPAQGTAAMLAEYRIWNGTRSAEEIRNAFKTSLKGGAIPSDLVHYFTGVDWGKLRGKAEIVSTTDFPPLMSASDARELAAKFQKFRALSRNGGDVTRGKGLVRTSCMQCHNVQGEGGQIGPTLNGAGAMDPEGLLHSILTPNEAVESGYYTYRVETTDGDVLDGFLVSQDETAILLRQPNVEDQRIARSRIKRAGYTRMTIMPEGLLDPLKPEEVSDLFAYLKTLK